jgi:hypothetical protein
MTTARVLVVKARKKNGTQKSSVKHGRKDRKNADMKKENIISKKKEEINNKGKEKNWR